MWLGGHQFVSHKNWLVGTCHDLLLSRSNTTLHNPLKHTMMEIVGIMRIVDIILIMYWQIYITLPQSSLRGVYRLSLRNATPTGLCRIGGSYPERFGSILLKVLSMAAYAWMDTMRMFISAMVENGLGLCDDLLRITATNMI